MNTSNYHTLDDLFADNPWRTKKKFIPLAVSNGFTKREAERFLDEQVVHDSKYNPEQYYLPIFSQRPGAFQFDTLQQTTRADPRYFLIVININSRKLYAYPMVDKNSRSVLQALTQFKRDVQTITSMTSDRDKAYLSSEVLSFMKSNRIDYRTTEAHDHNKLGIINRVIRTIRDLNQDRDFTRGSMAKCVKAYNASVHSTTNIKPNDFNASDEKRYIHKMIHLTDSKRSTIPIGTHVRTVLPKDLSNNKRRSTFSTKSYIVDDYTGNQYIIRANDHSTAIYPRHQLIQAKPSVKLADTIDNDAQGVIESITGHALKGRRPYYDIVYEGGVKDRIPLSSMRELRPTVMTPMEKAYWRNKTIPQAFA